MAPRAIRLSGKSRGFQLSEKRLAARRQRDVVFQCVPPELLSRLGPFFDIRESKHAMDDEIPKEPIRGALVTRMIVLL